MNQKEWEEKKEDWERHGIMLKEENVARKYIEKKNLHNGLVIMFFIVFYILVTGAAAFYAGMKYGAEKTISLLVQHPALFEGIKQIGESLPK